MLAQVIIFIHSEFSHQLNQGSSENSLNVGQYRTRVIVLQNDKENFKW
jgi:hypothetical protein